MLANTPCQKRLIPLFLALALIPLSTLGQPIPVIGKPGPHVKILLPTYEFPTVDYGVSVTHEFLFRNEGDQPLVVQKVTPKCPCIEATADTTVAPGKLGKVRVKMDTTALDGPQRHLITLETNDPKLPQVNMALQGTVRGPIVISPSRLVQKMFKGESKTYEIVVQNNRKQPLRIEKVSSTSPVLSPKLATVRAGKQYRIELEVDPNTEAGRHRGQILIQTKAKGQPPLEVPFELMVMSAIQIRPNVIYVGGKEGSIGTATESVELRHLRGRKFELKTVSSNLTGTSFERATLAEGGYTLKVKVPLAGLSKGVHSYSLSILTDAPDAPRLSIPISIRID